MLMGVSSLGMTLAVMGFSKARCCSQDFQGFLCFGMCTPVPPLVSLMHALDLDGLRV